MTEKRYKRIESSSKMKSLHIIDPDSTPINKLDDFCLDLIFQYLNICERVQIERVCKRWQYVSRQSWYTFNELDFSLKRGWPKRHRAVDFLDQEVIQPVLQRCGRFLKSLNLSVEGVFKIYHSENISVIIAATCHKLQVLDMSVLSVPAEAFICLIPHSDNLRKLVFTIEGEPKACEVAILNLLRKTKKLKYFNTEYNLIHLDYFPADTIEEIILNGSIIRISPEIENFTKLHTLVLYKCKNLNDCYLDLICSHMNNLKVLKLFGAFASKNEGIEILSSDGMKHLGKLKNLEKLNVEGNFNVLTDEVMKEIANNCRKITFLNISHNYRLSDMAILELAKLKQLRYLIMNSSEITGEHLWKLTSLENLDCKWCRQLKSKNVCTLVERSTNLKFLNCLGCYNINNDFLETAADATACRGNGTVLEICTLNTSVDLGQFKNRSPRLRINNLNADDFKYYDPADDASEDGYSDDDYEDNNSDDAFVDQIP